MTGEMWSGFITGWWQGCFFGIALILAIQRLIKWCGEGFL